MKRIGTGCIMMLAMASAVISAASSNKEPKMVWRQDLTP